MTCGIVNVLKPPGMTSHDVVAFLRRLLGIKRIGHAGTLDPAAAGVLPVFVGAATRFIEYTAAADKSYRVEMEFGYATDTGDITGEIIDRHDGPLPLVAQILAVLPTFIGRQEQIPPMYSAIKFKGKKLYELARQGITVDRQPRIINITDIKAIKVTPTKLLFDVTCSKGTYIRTLCTDIGNKVGCPAVMSFLIRTRVGPFFLHDSLTLEELAVLKNKALKRVDTALEHLPALNLTTNQSQQLLNGQAVTLKPALAMSDSLVRLYNSNHNFIGIGRIAPASGNKIIPVKILPRN